MARRQRQMCIRDSSKGEKQKSKEFFSQIITLENANLDILKETQKRLNRDLSE